MMVIVLSVGFVAITPNVIASYDCSEAIETIKAEHWKTIKKKDMSWYGAGLILGLHYVEKDCDTSKEKMKEVLADLWTAQKEYGFDMQIIDRISAGIRFVDKQL